MATSATIGLLRVLLTANTAEFSAAMKQASASAKTWSKDLNTIGQQATQIGMTLTKAITLPLVAMAAGAVKSASDFESSFAGVRKTVNATEPEFQAMAQQFRDLSKEIPINVNELNRLGEAAGALGIPKAEIVDFARVMALLGVTTDVTADQAAEGIAKIQNIFGAAGKDTDRFAATLVALGNDGASTESQILSMATRISGAGNVIGLSQGQVLGFASALSSVGLEAEAGGTAISRVFIEMAAAVNKGGESVAGFARVAGKPVQEFSRLFKEDASQAVLAFVQGLSQIKTSGGDLLGTLEALGFSEIRVRDALLRTAGAGDLLSKALSLQEDAWRENGALTEEARKRFETTEAQLTLLWNRVKDVGITLGNALLPSIRDAIKAMDGLIPLLESASTWFAGLSPNVRNTALAVGLLGAAAGPAAIVVGHLALAASGLAAAFTAQGLVPTTLKVLTGLIRGIGITSVGAAVGVNTLKTSLLGLIGIAGGVVAAVGGIAVAWANFKGDWTRAFDVLIPPIGFFRTGIDGIKKALTQTTAPMKMLSSHAGEVSGALTPMASHGAAAAASVESLGRASDQTSIQVVKSKEAIKEAAKAAAEAKKSIEQFRDSIKSLVNLTEAWVDTGRGVRAMFSQLAPTIRSTAEEIRMLGGALRDLPSDTSWVADTWVPFRAAVKDAEIDVFRLGDSIRSSLGDALAGIPETLSRAFEGGGSLSGAFASIGVQIADSILQPMMKGWTKFQKMASGIGSSVAAGVGGAVGGSTLATVAGLAGSIGGAALATTAFGAAMAGAIGTTAALGVATAGVGLAVVGVVAAYKKWFTVSKEVKQAREETEKFEDAIIDTLTATQRAEAGGERWREVLIGVRDTFLQTGRTADDASRLVGQMFDTGNPERSRAAIAEIGLAYEQLAEQQRIVAEGAEEANGIFGDLFDTAATFGNTMPNELRPMIDTLIELGVVGDDTAARLAGISAEGNVDFKAMEATAKEFGIEVSQLGDKFQGQRLAADAQNLWRGFQLLTKGGTDANVVMNGMRDEITHLVRDSIQFGTAIPENFRPWIEQLEASGGLVDENGERITDLSQLKFGPPIVDQWQMISDKLSELIDKITNALPRAINSIPPGNVDVRVRVDDRELRDLAGRRDLGVDTPEFATGSGGIRDFGAGTLAMLHGREGVYTESQIEGLQSAPAVGGLSIAIDARESFWDTPSSMDRLVKKIEAAVDRKLSLGRRAPAFAGAR